VHYLTGKHIGHSALYHFS